MPTRRRGCVAQQWQAEVIRTLLHERAYAQAYRHSRFRTAALARHLHCDDTERRHSSALGFATRAQRLAARR